MRKITTSAADRIILLSMPEPNTGCWLWSMGLYKKGYGAIQVNGKTEKAHRVSFSVFKGEIPKGMCVCHSCDVTSCVNPDHLFLGTQQDNIADMNRKNRHAKGVRARARLTVDDVLAIKKAIDKTKNLALKYNVSGMQIRRIRRGVSWSHLKELE